MENIMQVMNNFDPNKEITEEEKKLTNKMTHSHREKPKKKKKTDTDMAVNSKLSKLVTK